MRKIISSSDVAHYWANKIQLEGSVSGGSFYFRGDTIYSYGTHFPIARHYESKAMGTVVLFVNRGWSSTTAKHIYKVSSASSHLIKVYCSNPCDPAEYNFKAFEGNADEILSHLPKAKKPGKYLSQLETLKYHVNRYATCVGAVPHKSLLEKLDVLDKDKYAEIMEKERKAEVKRAAALRRKINKEIEEKLSKWRNFERDYSISGLQFDEIRLNKDSNRFETTQGVHIPFEIGRTFYDKVSSKTLKVDDEILGYSVRSVTDKVITVGCHKFKTDYLLTFKKYFTNEQTN